VLDRHRLHDHPAHRRADNVRRIDAEMVQQADGISGHVGQPIRRVDGLTREPLGELRAEVEVG